MAGLFFAPLAYYGGGLSGEAQLPWAKRFYGSATRASRRGDHRFRHNRVERLYDRFRILIGGRPDRMIEAAERDPGA